MGTNLSNTNRQQLEFCWSIAPSVCLFSVFLSTVEGQVCVRHIRIGPGKFRWMFLWDRIIRISLSSCRTVRWFSSSNFSVVIGVFSCNRLPLLVNFVLLLLVWYGTPPNFTVRFAKGILLHLLTDISGSLILFFLLCIPWSGVNLFSFWSSCNSSSMLVWTGLPSNLL